METHVDHTEHRYLRVPQTTRRRSTGLTPAEWIIFVWYMVLPIARDGAPFRASASSGLFVAPDWVWVVAFTGFGLAVGACYAFLRPSASPLDDDG